MARFVAVCGPMRQEEDDILDAMDAARAAYESARKAVVVSRIADGVVLAVVGPVTRKTVREMNGDPLTLARVSAHRGRRVASGKQQEQQEQHDEPDADESLGDADG